MEKYDELIDLALRRGFFFPAAEIYNGPAGFWDYGPLGVTLKNKFIQLWREHLVKRDGMLEIDGAQILPQTVFAASGHLEHFVDPLIECSKCGTFYRADKLLSEKLGRDIPESLSCEEFDKLIGQAKLVCPRCKGKFKPTKKFNMMFSFSVGPRADEIVGLRPETCQSIFLDFPRLFRICRAKLPIALAQIGKAFRNEISPRQALLRQREFTQAEIEVFFNPERANEFEKFDQVADYELVMQLEGQSKPKKIKCADLVKKKIVSSKLIAYYLALLQQFYEKVGLCDFRFRQLGKDEKAFYAIDAFDFEVKTEIGWIELVACNYRGDHDLGGHQAGSKKNLTVLDEGKKVLPHIFELSMGVDRSIFCLLLQAIALEKVGKEERLVLRLPPRLAPISVAIYPLLNKDGLPEKAMEVYGQLKGWFDVIYDSSGSIGKRYRRADEIGIPFCVTIDHQTLKDNTVTIRDRDSMKQERIKIAELVNWLGKKVCG